MTNEEYEIAEKYWIEKDKESIKLSKEEIIKAYEEYVTSKNVCALSTGYENFIRCTPIEYSYFNHMFYLFSEGGLKFKALKKNKNVCLAIFNGYEGFSHIKGLQVTGTAELIPPFNEEYLNVANEKKLSVEAFKKMQHPMNLIKITPTHIDFLNTDFKKLGASSRQTLDL